MLLGRGSFLQAVNLSLKQITVHKLEYQSLDFHTQSGSKVIKLFSFIAQLRLKFILLINVKMPTITFISRINHRVLHLQFQYILAILVIMSSFNFMLS